MGISNKMIGLSVSNIKSEEVRQIVNEAVKKVNSATMTIHTKLIERYKYFVSLNKYNEYDLQIASCCLLAAISNLLPSERTQRINEMTQFILSNKINDKVAERLISLTEELKKEILGY